MQTNLERKFQQYVKDLGYTVEFTSANSNSVFAIVKENKIDLTDFSQIIPQRNGTTKVRLSFEDLHNQDILKNRLSY